MPPDLHDAKSRLRAEAKQRRAGAAAAAPDAGQRLCRLLLEAFDGGAIALPPGAAVSAYWSKGDEIDARPVMAALSGRGHTLGLPVVVGRGLPLVFRRWSPGAALVPAGFGLEEPDPDQPEVTPRVLLVPLLAFDRAGTRLGYGGGFYDRTLEKLRGAGQALAVGLAYGAQEWPALPHDETDRPLDFVATETAVFAAGAA